MLVSCLFRAVFIVKAQDDFEKLSGSQNAYLASDFNLRLEIPVVFKSGFLDCVGHQISSKFQVFGAVSGAMIRNCTFRLEKQFATTIDNTTLTNVTIITSETTGCQTVVSNSEFHGVRIQTSSQFAANVSGTLFVGCAFSLLVEQSNKNQSFIGNMTNCTVQNCFLNASIAVNASVSVAGLALRSTDLLLLKSRFVTNIIAAGDMAQVKDKPLLSGSVGEASKALTIANCDFLTAVLASGYYTRIAGILAFAQPTADLTLRNLTSRLSAANTAGNEPLLSLQHIGGVVAYSNAKSANFANISSFNKIMFQRCDSLPFQKMSVFASGLIAQLGLQQARVSNCFAFGDIELASNNTGTAYVAGCVAFQRGSQLAGLSARNVGFSGNVGLTSAIGHPDQLQLGGVAAFADNCKLEHCQFHGNLHSDNTQLPYSYVGALLANGNPAVVIDFCQAAANITVKFSVTQHFIDLGCISGNAGLVRNSLASCAISIVHSGKSGTVANVGMLGGVANGDLENCSASGSILFSVANVANISGVVGGLVGSAKSAMTLSNLFFRGSITVPSGFAAVASAFGELGSATISSVIVAADVYGATARAYLTAGANQTVAGFFVDCVREGNTAEQDVCRTDLTTDSTLPMLGAAFSWNSAHNGGYPYPNMLPVLDANKKYVLPGSGGFSAPAYFVDDAGLPFPKTDFQPCRGVCYGIYSSPVTRVCDDAFEYCLDVDRARREFPDDSCIADNAVCNAGASFCSSEAEMLVVADTSEYACQNTCSGCQNGYCNQSKCVCDIYNAGDSCTPKCDADKPLCFESKFLVCDINNTKCVSPPSCDNMTCVHGGCVDRPIAHCECKNHWQGDLCDSCKANFDPATDCTRCKAAMEVIDGGCACGQAGVVCKDSFFCSSGICQKSCMLLGKNCTSCSQTHFDLCGGCIDGLVLKNGVCMAPKGSSAAALAGGVVGGCAAIAAAGAIVFFVLKSRKTKSKSLSKAKTKTYPFKDQQPSKVQAAIEEPNQALGSQHQAYTDGTGVKGIAAEP